MAILKVYTATPPAAGQDMRWLKEQVRSPEFGAIGAALMADGTIQCHWDTDEPAKSEAEFQAIVDSYDGTQKSQAEQGEDTLDNYRTQAKDAVLDLEAGLKTPDQVANILAKVVRYMFGELE